MFPKLCSLKIEEASELEQVFIHKQDDMEKITMVDEVFPELSNVILRKLPRLVTICEGIDFQTLEDCEVDDCPQYQGINHIQEGSEDSDSENQTATNSSPNFAKELEHEHQTSESIMQLQQEGLVETTTTKASHKTNILFHDNSIDAILKERTKEGSASEDVVATTMVADLAPRNSWSVKSSVVSQLEGLKYGPSTLVASMKEKHEQRSQGDDATRKAAIAIQSTNSKSMKQTRISSIIAQNLEDTKKEAVRRHALQLSIAPTSTNLKVTQGIKDTMEQDLKDNYPEDEAMISVQVTNSNLRNQSTIGPSDNLSRKDSAMNSKEKAKGVHEKATATDTLAMETPFESEFTVEEARDHSSVQKEAESKKPIKAILPQVIPSLHYQSQYADAGSPSPKLGICEIFRLVELKHGETALLAQALEQYPQLLLPRANRTHPIIAWSYRVLVDILVMLDAKTPNTITQSEKSTLEANLSEAIVLGYDKDWVEYIRTKVFGVDSLKLGICEIFRLVELKHGEIALLAQALEQYPQLLLPRANRTHRIIAWSYRVLVDILVMLDTKTPNTITQSENSTLEANLSEAIVLGFDKEWVEFIRAKVFGVDMSDVSAAREEIQVMDPLREIESRLLGLSEYCKKLIESMTMCRGIVSAKDKPFGI
ncbi:hypothetical protein K1719_012168 [Acacia pycnantha]|nr:hypothetical protein K1719_012168 [Acacia pycnantha]